MPAASKADVNGQLLPLEAVGELMKALTHNWLSLKGKRTCALDRWQIRATEPAGR